MTISSRATVEGADTVTVPAGTFRAWRVRVESDFEGSHASSLKWYAPGVGLVQEKTVMSGKKGETKIETKLKSFTRAEKAPDGK